MTHGGDHLNGLVLPTVETSLDEFAAFANVSQPNSTPHLQQINCPQDFSMIMSNDENDFDQISHANDFEIPPTFPDSWYIDTQLCHNLDWIDELDKNKSPSMISPFAALGNVPAGEITLPQPDSAGRFSMPENREAIIDNALLDPRLDLTQLLASIHPDPKPPTTPPSHDILDKSQDKISSAVTIDMNPTQKSSKAKDRVMNIPQPDDPKATSIVPRRRSHSMPPSMPVELVDVNLIDSSSLPHLAKRRRLEAPMSWTYSSAPAQSCPYPSGLTLTPHISHEPQLRNCYSAAPGGVSPRSTPQVQNMPVPSNMNISYRPAGSAMSQQTPIVSTQRPACDTDIARTITPIPSNPHNLTSPSRSLLSSTSGYTKVIPVSSTSFIPDASICIMDGKLDRAITGHQKALLLSLTRFIEYQKEGLEMFRTYVDRALLEGDSDVIQLRRYI